MRSHFLNKIIIHLRNLVNYNQTHCAQDCVEKAIEIYRKTSKLAELDQLISELAKLNRNLHDYALQFLQK